MYCGYARLCVYVFVCLSVCLAVCLSAAACPRYCTDPDVTWRSGRGCPLVVHYWADLQSVDGLRCYGNNVNRRYKLAFVSDIAVFVLKRDANLQPTNQQARLHLAV